MAVETVMGISSAAGGRKCDHCNIRGFAKMLHQDSFNADLCSLWISFLSTLHLQQKEQWSNLDEKHTALYKNFLPLSQVRRQAGVSGLARNQEWLLLLPGE